MKKLPLILSVIAMIAVIILYVLHYTANSAVSTESDNPELIVDSTETPEYNVDIAYVNIDSLLMDYEFYKELEAKLKKRKASLEADLNRKASALEKDMNDFQYKAQNNLFMSEASAESQYNDLLTRREKLAYSEQEISQTLINEGMVMEQQIFDTIINYIEQFNSDHKYRYILNGGNLLYGEKSLDITDTLLILLNEKYKMNTAGTVPEK